MHVMAQPGARRDEIVGEHDGCLKIRISAPPVEGAANAALIKFLAKLLNVKKRDVVVLKGETSRRKRMRIVGVSVDVCAEKLGIT